MNLSAAPSFNEIRSASAVDRTGQPIRAPPQVATEQHQESKNRQQGGPSAAIQPLAGALIEPN